MPAAIAGALQFDDDFVVAGNFPPGLNTADPVTALGADESPDCYGVSMARDGVLSTGTIPTGTAKIQKTTTISSVPYVWAYDRLWNITALTASTASNILYYGAPLIDDVYFAQKTGKIPCDDDAQTILVLVPFGQDSMCIAKSTGSYILSNLADTRAFFSKSQIIQELYVSTATNMCELDNAVFASNALGLFAYSEGQTVEMTRKVRNDLTNFGAQAITADYAKKRIIGTSYAYDVLDKKLFYYSSSLFRYTTRQYHLPDWSPFAADGMLITVQHGTTAGGSFTYQLKIEDDDWQDPVNVNVPYDSETFTIVREGFYDSVSCSRIQLRFTALSSNIYIKEIRLDARRFQRDDYKR
jgi:hypothetical protein